MFIRIKNFFLCLKYPFLKARNVWSDKFLGYSSTWYDDIPEGWQKAFGKQLCKELKVALKKDKCLKKFRFNQIKEKWGELCLYAMNYGKETEKVLTYYEDISKAYCINCGKPVRYMTSGWISYVCENCALEYILERASDKEIEDIDEIDKKLNAMRVNKEYAGKWNCSDPEIQKIHDDIDWNKLWGLDENGK